ncbi:SMI1/KNR4 family protein [Kribbella sp. NPDC058693]|uniref:SMI1/KNR4 family protein n=1 Tax=Kribbella sp. NPDC058693 TaxID=3346602 RepID=UPI00364E24B3
MRAGEASVGTRASGELIDSAEAALGQLPTDYKTFLRKFGYASIGPDEICGLGQGIPRYLDVVELSLAERHDSAGLPPDGVVLFNDGGGNLAFLKASESDPSPVYSWFHEDPGAIQIDSPSFFTWLLAKLATTR